MRLILAGLLLIGCSASVRHAPEPSPRKQPIPVGDEARRSPGKGSPVPAGTASAPAGTSNNFHTGPVGVPLSVPVSVLAADPEARWLAYCSAEADTDGDGQVSVDFAPSGALAGDLFSAKLMIGEKPSVPIESYFDADPTGRFVLVQSEGHVVLFDSATSTRTDMTELGADCRIDLDDRPGHRAFAFSSDGGRMAYLRRKKGKLDVVVRALETGAETAFDPGVSEIFRVAFDAMDTRLVLDAVALDSNKNGRFDWPFPLAKAPKPACTGPVRRLGARYRTGDATVALALELAGGSLRQIPDLVTFLDEGPVIRRASGELVLDPGTSKPALLATSQCGGRVLFADASKNLLLLGCPGTKAPGRAEVELVARGYLKRLGVAVQPTELDARAVREQRLVPLYPGGDTLLIDLARRETHLLKPSDLVIHIFETRALVRRRDRLFVFDVETRSELELEVTLDALPYVLTQGRFAVVTPAVVDVGAGALVGVTRERPLALSRSGQLLVAAGGGPSAERLARGPLTWKAPEPASANRD